MKFALVAESVQEARPGSVGKCRDCQARMIAKCSDLRMWHWAHSKVVACDPWWEPVTEWHRNWKNRFPVDWQEISHRSPSGEKHRADVKTAKKLVFEFQYSALSQDERKSREGFYPRLVWVVSGLRRKRDSMKFFASLRGALPAYSVPTFTILREESALLRDWGESRVPVYFDFGESTERPPLMSALWRLHPGARGSTAYVSPMNRAEFLAAHLAGEDIESMFAHIIQRDSAYFQRSQNVQSSSVSFGRPPVRRQWRRL